MVAEEKGCPFVYVTPEASPLNVVNDVRLKISSISKGPSFYARDYPRLGNESSLHFKNVGKPSKLNTNPSADRASQLRDHGPAFLEAIL